MLRIAIDLGTSVTKIYKMGSGIVLSEATCVAVNNITGGIKAFGDEAKSLLGRTAEQTSVVFPVFEGEIIERKMAAALLDEFLKKIGIRSGRRSVEALFIVPCGVSEEAKASIYSVCDDLEITKTYFVESPYLAALGQDLPVSNANPVFVMDIGAGITNIAAVSTDGLIAGISINIGGNNIDSHIVDYVADAFGLKIGPLTAERLKNTVGSLIEGDNQSMIVNGRDLDSGKPRSIAVNSADIVYPILVYIDKIVEYAVMILRKLPAEVSAVVCHGGLHISGGVAGIAGIEEYIGDKLAMDAYVAEEAQMAAILGAGRTLGNSDLMKKLSLPI